MPRGRGCHPAETTGDNCFAPGYRIAGE